MSGFVLMESIMGVFVNQYKCVDVYRQVQTYGIECISVRCVFVPVCGYVLEFY